MKGPVRVCAPPQAADIDHFVEMLRDKGQAKIDMRVEVPGDGENAVSFQGSYVVLEARRGE